MASEGDTIILITRNFFQVYDANDIFKLDIPETILRDLEIIDRSGFDVLVDKFIKDKKLGTGVLWIILAEDVCFGKDISESDGAKLEEIARDFLESVPFDQVISKRFKSQSGVRVIAGNLELVEAVSEIFGRNGFVSGAVVPGAIFTGYGTSKNLLPEYARFVLANKHLARAGNMLASASVPTPASEAQVEPEKKKNRLLPYLLIGFGILLIILVASLLTKG